MFKKIFILTLFILFNCFAAADENIEIYFYIDGTLNAVPEAVLEKLQDLPNSEVDQVLIKELIHTGVYDNVIVNEYIDTNKSVFYIVNAQTSQKIHAITIQGLDKATLEQLQRIVDLEVGSRYSPEVITRLRKKLEVDLKNSGYLTAKIIDIQPSITTEGLIDIVIKIDSGKQCVIQQIVMPTAYLNFLQLFDFPIDVGAPCHIAEINDGLEQIQQKYWSNGYLQAKVSIGKIKYTRKKDKATIYVNVDQGKRTILQINDQSSSIFNTNFLDPKAGGLTYSDLISLSDADLRNAILSFYQRQGYASAQVGIPKRFNDKDGNHVIAFDVIKGPTANVNKIFFLGETLPITQEEVEDEMELTQGTVFRKELLSLYKEKFQKILLEYGYNDALIYDFDFYFSADKTLVNVIIKYELNTQFIVSSIDYNNFPPDIKIPRKKFDGMLKPGDPLWIEKRQEIANELQTILFDHGYLYAQVEGNMRFNSNDIKTPRTPVKITFQAIPGPQVKIRRIIVEGDTYGKADTILSISNLKVGSIFTQQKLDAARDLILKHSLFTSASIDFLDPQTLEKKEPVVDLVIKVRGKKGMNFSLSPAYGSGTGYRVDSNFIVNNLTSRGLRLTLDASVRQEIQQQDYELSNSKQILGQRYSIALTEPLFKFFSLQTPIDLSLIGGYQVVAESLLNREITSVNLYGEWKPRIYGADINLSVSLNQGTLISLSPANTATAIFDSPDLLIRDITPKITIDSRNNAGWPTKGFIFNGLIGVGSYAFGSNLRYTNYDANMKIYFPIYKKLSMGIYLGVTKIQDVKNKDSNTLTPPANLRTYLINDSLIRGFPDNYIYTATGPLLWLHAQNQSPTCNTQLQSVGGTRMIYIKTEARYRINDNFGLVAFGDSGTTYFSNTENASISAALQALGSPVSQSGNSCILDQAALVPTPAVEWSSFVDEYWKKAYMSIGLGFRIILGSFMTVRLDYGYPLKDPALNQAGCMTIEEALSSNTPPPCVNRIQKSQFFTDKIKYKGAVHFGVDASF